MTPQSVGAPHTTLVLGKHSGRHALGLRCEQLGHAFDRRELDEVYRRFVVLADKIKVVEDHHLMQLIEEARRPAATVGALQIARAASAGKGYGGSYKPFPTGPSVNVSTSVPFATSPDHHADQEDYLWGV
jgi:homocitrate synthase-like protein